MPWVDKTLILAMILTAGFIMWSFNWKAKPKETELYPFLWFCSIFFFLRGLFKLQAEVFLFLFISLYLFIVFRLIVLSKEEDKTWPFAYFAGWLVPGAGHFVLGKKIKAVLLFSIVLVVFLVGFTLTGLKPIAWEDNPFYYLGRFGSGIFYLIAEVVASGKADPVDGMHMSIFEAGLLYCCVAGILNLVICINIFTARK